MNVTDSSPASLSTAPTAVRWQILAVLMMLAALGHFNRISISVAGAEYIMPKYGISPEQMGWVYSAYLFVYTACMVPGGWLIDRLGPRRALLYLCGGSVLLVPATGLTALAPAAGLLTALCLVRGALGLVSAPLHPAAARMVSFWLPAGQRSWGNGLVTAAAVAGIACTYEVFGRLMDTTGWPLAFGVMGGVTLLMTVLWKFQTTDHPAEHPRTNAAEQALIGEPLQPSAPTAAEFGQLLCDRNLICLTLCYAAYSYFQYMFFYWVEHYFLELLKMSKDQARLYTTFTIVGMAAGMALGGVYADWFERRVGGWLGRAGTPLLAMIGSAILLACGTRADSAAQTVAYFTAAMTVLGACEPAFWVTGIEIGRRRGGLSAAILNTGGNGGGILAAVLTPILGAHLSWQDALDLAAVICFLGAGLWLGVRRREEA